MDALASRLAPLWVGMVVHLWQSALFLAVLALVALALRRASARILCGLYWIGVLKLLLPLPLLAPITDRLLDAFAVTWTPAPVAEAGWATVSVLMYPVQVGAPSAVEAGLPPSLYVAASVAWLLVAGTLLARRLRAGRLHGPLELRRIEACPLRTASKLGSASVAAGCDPASIRISATSPGPHVRGAWRPVVVLPEAVVEELDGDELRAVLIHEREHLRRRDPLRFAVLGAVRDLFWFYPPVWWLARRIRETAEMACDESVVIGGLTAATYCRSLARTLSLGLSRQGAASPVGILGHRVSFLRRRLERIRSGRRFETMFSHRFALIAAAVLALVFSLLPVAPVDGLRPQAGETGPVKGLDSLEAADQEVALSFRQAPLDSILETIGDATGVRFRIRGEVGDRLVDFDTGGERRLVQVLEKLFQTARLSHRVLGPDEVEVMPIAAAGVDDVTLPVLIPESKVDPVYPEQARDRRIQGTVKLQAFIDTDGTVQAVEVLQAEVTQDGEAIAAGDEHDTQYLVTSAMEAVRQWRYEPATKNGVPVPVFLTIQTDFRLN